MKKRKLNIENNQKNEQHLNEVDQRSIYLEFSKLSNPVEPYVEQLLKLYQTINPSVIVENTAIFFNKMIKVVIRFATINDASQFITIAISNYQGLNIPLLKCETKWSRKQKEMNRKYQVKIKKDRKILQKTHKSMDYELLQIQNLRVSYDMSNLELFQLNFMEKVSETVSNLQKKLNASYILIFGTKLFCMYPKDTCNVIILNSLNLSCSIHKVLDHYTIETFWKLRYRREHKLNISPQTLSIRTTHQDSPSRKRTREH